MKRKSIILGLLSVFAISTYVAQPTLVEKVEAKPGKLSIPYERWKLPNGLTILLHEDHSDPVVNVMVTYKVGSNREDLGKSGFAHFFEHMMFQGSLHVADEEHFKMVSTAGGNMNGFTQRDKTVYFETLPSNYLEMGLWLEADRMGFLLDSLTSKKFENQRDAVKNEKSQNFENRPYGLAFVEEIGKALYPFKHPYSWPVIGYVDDLNRATLDDVKNFFLRWYGPNNAILTVSGDFTPADALKMIDKYFGGIKPCPEVKKLRVPPVVIPTDKYTAYKDRTYFPLNLRVYPTVGQYHKDEPALDLLAMMMGGGNNSLFYKNFVKNEMAIQAGVDHRSEELSGEFSIQIFAYPPEDFNLEGLFTKLDEKVKATIDEFGTSGITDEALARVKAEMESRYYDGLDEVFNKGSVISEWERLLGRPSTITDEIERYTKVTKEDITRVFNKYIKGSGAAILNTYPIMNQKDSVKSINPNAGATFPANPEYAGLSYKPNVDNFNRAERPKAGEAKTVKAPEFYQTTLKNGMKVLGTKATESPMINITINLDGGDMALTPDQLKKFGLAQLATGLMNEGTKNYTTEQMAAELEKLGSSISIGAGKMNNTINVSCLKKNLDATLKLLEEKLLNPGWRAEDFKLAKKQYKESVKDQKTNAQSLANKAFNQAIYGPSSVLGMEPTVKTIDAIELKDCQDYYNNCFSTAGGNIVVVGDVTDAEIVSKLDFLNKMNNKEVKMQAIPEPPAKAEQQFFIQEKTAAPSSVIMMGYPAMKYDATGDYFKSQIANFAFGGAFNSRLNLNLREDKGYTYGIRSSFSGNKFNGTFLISSSVKRPATVLSLAEITKEFNNYVQNGITDKELEFTKQSMLNVEALRYESPWQKAGFLANIARYNLPKDYVAQQNQILKTITKDELNAHIKKVYDPNKLTTVIVGDKAYIEAALDRAMKDAKNKEVLNNVKFKKISVD
ncbi:MAG: insulinase family protein [Bacteroidetes bacterium]|nr:insulinase family protein [Bacteroidota bacterium]